MKNFPSRLMNVLVNPCVLVSVCSITESRPILYDPMDERMAGSPVHGIFQASMLEWIAISSSRGPSRPRDQTQDSCMSRQILYHSTTWEALNISHDQSDTLRFIASSRTRIRIINSTRTSHSDLWFPPYKLSPKKEIL